MCLLHWRIAISHLRGEESDGDEELVRTWASEHGVRIHVRDFDTETYARENGISIEMAARDLRYAWFAQLCLDHGYKAVSVAHNANDNAETLVLNMLRGAGLRGLSGMSVVSSVPGFPSIPLLRPLLDCTRKQIEGYMFAHKVSYREDSTNAMSEYKRNRIRNETFSIFETVNPSFVRTLNREMGYFSEAG
jgi:tRNA(Ile)-lysidine synthase